ncbi:MAG: hypothetical protein WEF28_09945 [Acidimicrobiia bacterium]
MNHDQTRVLLAALTVVVAACTGPAQVEVTTTPAAAATTTTTAPATTTTAAPATTTTTPDTTTTTLVAGQGSGQEAFTFNGWGSRLDENNCPSDPVEAYPSGTTQLLARFLFDGMTDGQDVYYEWTVDDRFTIFSQLAQWTFGPASDCFWFQFSDPGGLPDGAYGLTIHAGTDLEGRTIGSAFTSVGGGADLPVEDEGGISLEGRIIDLDTGQGIAGALFQVLKLPEDMTPDEVIENFLTLRDMNLVAAFTETDADGFYQVPPLPPAALYPVVVEAPGYQLVFGTIEIVGDVPAGGGVFELGDIAMVGQ